MHCEDSSFTFARTSYQTNAGLNAFAAGTGTVLLDGAEVRSPPGICSEMCFYTNLVVLYHLHALGVVSTMRSLCGS